MIELINGVDYKDSDDIRRLEIPSRIASEKAQYPDELIVASQLSGGQGIFIEQSDGYDYIFDESVQDIVPVLSKNKIGNLFIRRFQDKYELSASDNDNFIPIDNWDRIVKLYGNPDQMYNPLESDKSLLLTADLCINGVDYHYNIHWEYINKGILWYGMFLLESKDEIILKV